MMSSRSAAGLRTDRAQLILVHVSLGFRTDSPSLPVLDALVRVVEGEVMDGAGGVARVALGVDGVLKRMPHAGDDK